MRVQDFLHQSVEKYPSKTALICGPRRLRYEEMESLANRLAHALIGQGLRRGERMAICLPNTVECVISIFGVLKAGGIVVLINPTTKKDKLAYILNDCQASGLIASSPSRALLGDIRARIPSVRISVFCGETSHKDHAGKGPCDYGHTFESLLGSAASSRPPCATIDQDLAFLIYTSGSTGEPKGVMAGHNNVVFVSGSIIRYLENDPEDRVINVLPLSFDYGLYQLLMVFRFGGTLILENSFAYPAYILKKMESEGVTGLPAVPTLVTLMLALDLGAFDLSRLRYLTNTADRLIPGHIKALRERLPWVTLYSMYGLTECKRALYLPPQDIENKPTSVGIPIPGTEAWIEDEAGLRLGPEVAGELVIRGSHVMRGYWNDQEKTAQVFRPGPTPGERVLYSGDLFWMDHDGYFYFVGRRDDLIKSAGEKVSPWEIERVLYGLAGIIEAAVTGVPDPILGQAVKAFVVSVNDQLTEEEIRHHCSTHLERFMVPKVVEFRKELPKNRNGKIDRKALAGFS